MMADRRAQPAVLTLAAGNLTLRLAPAIGGSIAGFNYRLPAGPSVDLMRPMTATALAAGDVLGASCFPLSPFSNRLREGRCSFKGQDIHLPLNSDGPHNEHGHGWQRPWAIDAQHADRATLLYRHEADAWPFAYEMRQHFQLSETSLTVTIESRNTGSAAMPYGFGLHPYFARTPQCRLSAPVRGFWAVDDEVMPTELLPVPAEANLTSGISVEDVELDNVFTGWSGEAIIAWPEHRLQLAMSADAPLRFLVVYVPKGEDHFCAEPVSNSTDAFNLCNDRDDTGMLVLEPGDRVKATIRFTPQLMTN
jgi:aldose 1-epimerase